MKMKIPFPDFIRRLARDKRGVTAIVTALVAPSLCGIGALCVDFAYIAKTERALQSSTDAAAMAGAANIANGTAASVATQYSASAGNLNAMSDVTVTMANGYPQLKCLTSTGVPCTGSTPANAIAVKQTAVVPTFFARVIGIDTVTITATSTAGEQGGGALPADVMFVLDSTASMNTTDTNCSVSGATRMTCALTGIQTVLKTLKPSTSYAGLMVFPGLTSATQTQYDTDCATANPTIASYKNSPVYQVVPLSNDFRTSDTATTLNPTSNIAKAAQEPGCAHGVAAVGGVGTFYADAIKAAQTALANSGRSTNQKIIVLLSDGDASATTANMPTGEATSQCHEAITAAQAAKTAGMWVYSIAYGASTSSTGSCSTDTSPHISACATMQQIASDPGKFYSDTSGSSSGACASTATSVSELVQIFTSIASSLSTPRLLLDTTS